MKRKELIESLIKDTKEVKKEATQLLSNNTLDQLKHKSDPKKWSAIECIEHLNIADKHYLDRMEVVIPQAGEAIDKETFSSGMMGNYFVKMMKPSSDGGIPSPMKTFGKFQPKEELESRVIEKFLDDQDKLVKWLELSKTIDLNKNKITSAIGPMLRFKLGDAFRFLIAHNQRHIIQAKNALKAAKTQTV